MLITGIRRKVGSELDERRSSLFTRYLIHYSRMFAFIGLFFTILIVVDYYCVRHSKDKSIINRYYKITDNLNHPEYHFFIDSYRFTSDVVFYENTNIGDNVNVQFTPIFKTITNVTHGDYECNPNNLYGWPLIIIGLTFFCSSYVILKTWGWMKKRIYVKYDSVVNWGIINFILCIITLIFIFFHIPY